MHQSLQLLAASAPGSHLQGVQSEVGAQGPGCLPAHHDAEGDRTSVTPPTGPATSYTYNQAEQLTGVSTTGLAASYAYDGDGVRMSKTVNGTTVPFTWDQSGSLPLLIEDGTDDYIYGPGGLTLEQVDGSGDASFFLHDWQGSTLALTSTDGSQVAGYTYDAYGNLISSSGTVPTPLLFQGQYRDRETGFYYLQARYYDPATGQFLSRDPLTAITELPYMFAKDDPIDLSDNSGQLVADGGDVGGDDGGADGAAPADGATGQPGAGGGGGTRVRRFYPRTYSKPRRKLEKITGPKTFNPKSLEGDTPAEVEERIPVDWSERSSRTGGGIIFNDPAHLNRQIRIMPGEGLAARDYYPLKEGPYVVVSQNGKSEHIALAGNPTLDDGW
ncbi:MAG TPA: RHS repeat-associated core domain-containing protein [Candidatus Dormibacteraeota bacterium]